MTPGPHGPGFHRFIIRASPCSTALQEPHGTRHGTCQPVVEPIGLTRTHQGAKVLHEVDRDRHVAVRDLELSDEVCVGGGAVR